LVIVSSTKMSISNDSYFQRSSPLPTTLSISSSIKFSKFFFLATVFCLGLYTSSAGKIAFKSK